MARTCKKENCMSLAIKSILCMIQFWEKKLGEKTSQQSFQKVFKPITSKLDDVALTNLNIPCLTKRRKTKTEAPDHGIAIENGVSNYGLEGLFHLRLKSK